LKRKWWYCCQIQSLYIFPYAWDYCYLRKALMHYLNSCYFKDIMIFPSSTSINACIMKILYVILIIDEAFSWSL
jgi:hypothetical protein